jgi:hypothetical protein
LRSSGNFKSCSLKKRNAGSTKAESSSSALTSFGGLCRDQTIVHCATFRLQFVRRIGTENAKVVLGHGHTTMQQIQLAMFFVAVAALVVTGCILTGKLGKRPVVRDEHQPGCFALEEERGGSWKGSGGTVPSVKEAKPSL